MSVVADKKSDTVQKVLHINRFFSVKYKISQESIHPSKAVLERRHSFNSFYFAFDLFGTWNSALDFIRFSLQVPEVLSSELDLNLSQSLPLHWYPDLHPTSTWPGPELNKNTFLSPLLRLPIKNVFIDCEAISNIGSKPDNVYWIRLQAHASYQARHSPLVRCWIPHSSVVIMWSVRPDVSPSVGMFYMRETRNCSPNQSILTRLFVLHFNNLRAGW